jgi:hypothetical protein
LTRVRRAPPERVDEPLRWLRANHHDLAPLTGTDTRALLAIAACWRLYFNADDQASVLRAVAELLASLQPKCWRLAKALIPWAGDWSHEGPVWQAVDDLVEQRRRDMLATVRRCRCTAHGACDVAIDDGHPSGLCYACRKRCAQ